MNIQKDSIRVTIAETICEFRKCSQTIVSVFVKNAVPIMYADRRDPEVFAQMFLDNSELFSDVNIIRFGGKMLVDKSADKPFDKVEKLHNKHVDAKYFPKAKKTK